MRSHSARSAWIETGFPIARLPENVRRTPQGVRGLKPPAAVTVVYATGRTPQGVRGLKLSIYLISVLISGRTPQGVRGLKL